MPAMPPKPKKKPPKSMPKTTVPAMAPVKSMRKQNITGMRGKLIPMRQVTRRKRMQPK